MAVASSAPQVNIVRKNTKFCDTLSNGLGHTCQNTIFLVDILNLSRAEINKPDAKFQTVDEFVKTMQTIARNIFKLGKFEKIFLVTKIFQIENEITYSNLPSIILWAFCTADPNFQNEIRKKICLVLVNGHDQNDRECHDRALFYLCTQYFKTTDKEVVIVSNDNFGTLAFHFFRDFTINFHTISEVGDSWQNSKIDCYRENKIGCRLEVPQKSVVVVHPHYNTRSLFTISA